MTQTFTQKKQYQLMKSLLNERQWRIYLGTEARKLGYGGILEVSRLSGADRGTVSRGIGDSQSPESGSRIRKLGGGRKQSFEVDPTLEKDLEALLEPKGDPMAPVLWTTKSLANLAKLLKQSNHHVHRSTLGNILHAKGFSLQANKKNIEGVSHPDRDAQFVLLNQTMKDFLTPGNPVISVDCKKKELLGNFRNNGREWQPKGSPEIVNVYDFPSLAEGKAVPYGIYDVLQNSGFVNVGTGNDTATFSVESIRRWWKETGQALYPDKHQLLITCDGGGSNGSRNRLWKKNLQELANETGLLITVRHYPPATSKWNQIEHKLFSYIWINWRGRPLTSLETVIQLISNTTTKSGLKITAVKDTNTYEKGIKVSDQELESLNIRREVFHGEWNYTIAPQKD